MKEMKTIRFKEDGDVYEIVDAEARDRVEKVIAAIGGLGESDLSGINFYRLHTKFINNDYAIVNDADQVLTFNDIKAAYEDTTKFVYCIHANVVLIPAFLETRAFEFTGTYLIRGTHNIIRVIINDENIVHTSDIPLETTDNKVDDLSDWESFDGSEVYYPTVEAILNYLQPLKEDLASINNTGDVTEAAGKFWGTTANGAGWVPAPAGSGGASAAEARLINTVQITEDVNNVLVTVDSNGNPLSITGNLLIEMVTGIGTKNVAMHINVNSDKLAYTEDKIIGTNVSCISTTTGYNILTMLRLGDKSVSFWANSKGSGASGTSTTQTYTGYRSVGVINSIRFGASNTSDLIPAGSEFKIYEVVYV